MQFKEQNKLKAFTLSYDDGITQDIRLIELLKKYNLKCTFNINSELLGRPGILARENKRISHYKVHPKYVKEIYEGHEVAAHTLTHPLLPTKDDAEVIRQVEEDRLKLSELVGYEVVGMAYPGGGKNYDDRVANLIKNNTGIKYARTTECTGDFEIQNDLYTFGPTAYHLHFDKMIDFGKKFIELKTDTPKIFYVWGHSYEMDFAPDNWVKLEKFFELISNRDDIFYGTNMEVLL